MALGYCFPLDGKLGEREVVAACGELHFNSRVASLAIAVHQPHATNTRSGRVTGTIGEEDRAPQHLEDQSRLSGGGCGCSIEGEGESGARSDRDAGPHTERLARRTTHRYQQAQRVSAIGTVAYTLRGGGRAELKSDRRRVNGARLLADTSCGDDVGRPRRMACGVKAEVGEIGAGAWRAKGGKFNAGDGATGLTTGEGGGVASSHLVKVLPSGPLPPEFERAVGEVDGGVGRGEAVRRRGLQAELLPTKGVLSLGHTRKGADEVCRERTPHMVLPPAQSTPKSAG